MRWPFIDWLRGAPGRDDPAPGAPETMPGAPETAPSAAPDRVAGPRVEPRPAAWRELPPVQRTVGAAPLTAPSMTFARDLSSRREPPPILGPLGHDVTADGPAGLVSGIAAPLVQRASAGSVPPASPPLPSAPARSRPTLQRAVTTVAALPPRGPADLLAAAAPGVPALEDTGVAAPAAVAAETPAVVPAVDDGPGPALRALPVARLATSTPAIAATRVADATAPAPVQALAGVVTPGAPSQRPAVGATPATAAIAPGDVTPAESTAGTSATMDVVPAEPGRSEDSAHPVVARRTLGESRRLGLGAPLVGPPPSATRESGRSDLPVARRARSIDAESPARPTVPALPAMPPAAASPAPLPRLVVARRSATLTTTIATAPASRPRDGGPEAPGAPDWNAAPDSREAVDDAPDRAPTDAAAGIAPGDAPGPTRPLVGESPIGVARLPRGDQGIEDDPDTAGDPGGGALHPSRVSAAWPGGDMQSGATGAGATSAPSIGGPAGSGGSVGSSSAAVQHTTGVAPASAAISASARSSSTMSTVPAIAPLVAARAMRPGQTPSMTGSMSGPAARADGVPSPVIARLNRAAFTVGGPDMTPGTRTTSVGHPGAPSAPGVAVAGDVRPVVARAAVGTGRGPAVSARSTLPLVHAAAGTASGGWPDGGPAGRSADAVSWTPAAGFTTVAQAPGPFVQRAVEINEVSVTADAAAAGAAESGDAGAGAGESGGAAAGQAATTGASAAGPGGAGTDYEEIAEHVYDRIRARLTSELLLDRERSGTLVDA